MEPNTILRAGHAYGTHAAVRPAQASAEAMQTQRERYEQIRAFTESLCTGLAIEDYVVQSMEDVSPTKWHLAHTSWFFETFLLMPNMPGYQPIDAQYAYLFNSYYVHAGERHCRAQRGYISRPTVEQVFTYRHHVDDAVRELIAAVPAGTPPSWAGVLELGLHHEQQHQELMLMDIKHVFSVNPLRPPYHERQVEPGGGAPGDMRWIRHEGGVVEIGHDGAGFAYDNESPRHRVFVEPFAIANRLVTAGEYLAFMEDGGYTRPELWLSLGWATVQEQEWTEPFYWERRDGEWHHYTLAGMRPVDPHEPVVHLSYFEADAFARWAGARLPTEFEWEHAAAAVPVAGNFADTRRFHPAPAPSESGLRQMFGDVWEWTRSQYSPYPGYRAADGALGEYNGKFMCNQFVLRGGSCVTSASHMRPSYRNFFAPEATWQFSGVRLAQDPA